MAYDDSTRTGFDLSPWRRKDPLTIGEAACLWYGLKPGMTVKLIELYPVEWANTRSRANDMAKVAEAGKLPIQGKVPTTPKQTGRAVIGSQYLGTPSRPATCQQVEDWGRALVALADLRAYAESIGQRPAFFFHDAAVEASGQSLNERVKERAQQIADALFEGGENQVSMTAVANKLTAEAETKRREKSDDALYIGQKGAHTLSWYKTELKGWQPEKIDRPRKK